MERIPSIPRIPLVERHFVYKYVSAPSPVFCLTTSQRTSSAADKITTLKAYINSTDTGYRGSLVLVIFIRTAKQGKEGRRGGGRLGGVYEPEPWREARAQQHGYESRPSLDG